MVSINYSAREVCCKIVYYGPGLSGKTTNLQYVHSKVPGNTRGDLISLATEADRTLYFDFLPINIGTINGFAAKFQLYTVPGQVYYNATRKLVLRGVDGIVFVADSQSDKMDENIESLANLEENLSEYGYNINEIPLVMQFNKRDLPNILSMEELNARLNPRGLPSFEAAAPSGKGVFDTLKLIIKMVLDRAKSKDGSRPQPATAAAPTTVSATAQEASSSPQPAPAPPAGAPEPNIADMTVRDGGAPAKPAPAPETVEQPAAGATAVATEEQPTPEKLAEALRPQSMPPATQYRPYPGSRTDNIGAPSEPGSEPATIPSGARTEQKQSAGAGSPGPVLNVDGVPSMAPSLRRSSAKKKRGFFKRLFGIK